MPAVRGARPEAASGKSTDVMAAHEALDVSTTAPVALCPQGGMHSWVAIAAMVPELEAPDLAHEDTVLSRSRTLRAAPLGVVAARRHLEHAAHEAHQVGAQHVAQ
jgi:hypothetical protein